MEGGLRDNLLFGPVTFQRKDWEAEDAAEELKSNPVKLLPLVSRSLHCVRVGEDEAVRFELKEYKRKELVEAFRIFDTSSIGLVPFNSVKLIGICIGYLLCHSFILTALSVEALGFTLSRNELREDSTQGASDMVSLDSFLDLSTILSNLIFN